MLSLAAFYVTLFVAFAHLGFMVLETFLWTQPAGMKIFRQTREQAEQTKVLAQNQGIYNGGVAALLAWAVFAGQGPTVIAVLIAIIVFGVYGAITAKGTILFFQALPAAIALTLQLLSN
jgi:putative membrane protein